MYQYQKTRQSKSTYEMNTLYYCFHPEEEEYIKSPKDMTAKYTVLPNAAHMMRGRDITVSVLLSFAAQSAAATTKALKNTIRETASDEVLKQKILNHRCYTELVRMITENISKVMG